jgi:type I restriction enzyme S subunit
MAQRLGGLCDVRIGRTPRRDSPQYWGGTATWVTVRELNGGVVSKSKEQISDLAVSEVMQPLIPAGTLLFSFKLSIGKMAIAGVPLYTNEAIAALVIRDAQVLDRDYLRYALMATSSEDGANHAVLGKVLNKEKVEGIEIPVPPLTEQRRIVDLLSRAEGIVRLRREAEKKAAELIPALFIDMFGDPATNPKGWAKASLGDLCIRITDGTHQPPKFQESGIPFIFVANIVQGKLSLNATKFISEETYTELTRRCPIELGDVLYSTVGSYGVPVKVDTDERFSFQRHIAHLKPDRAKLDSDFLVGILTTPALKAQADLAARGIAQKTINLGEIRKFEVITPSMDEQVRFATHVATAKSIQAQQSVATAKAQAAFDALLAQCFAQPAAT